MIRGFLQCDLVECAKSFIFDLCSYIYLNKTKIDSKFIEQEILHYSSFQIWKHYHHVPIKDQTESLLLTKKKASHTNQLMRGLADAIFETQKQEALALEKSLKPGLCGMDIPSKKSFSPGSSAQILPTLSSMSKIWAEDPDKKYNFIWNIYTTQPGFIT